MHPTGRSASAVPKADFMSVNLLLSRLPTCTELALSPRPFFSSSRPAQTSGWAYRTPDGAPFVDRIEAQPSSELRTKRGCGYRGALLAAATPL